MDKILKILNIISPLILNLTKTNDARELRRNIRSIKKNRRKIYKIMKKNGINEEEEKILSKIDTAWVNAVIELGIE
jgi:hypothetical protein